MNVLFLGNIIFAGNDFRLEESMDRRTDGRIGGHEGLGERGLGADTEMNNRFTMASRVMVCDCTEDGCHFKLRCLFILPILPFFLVIRIITYEQE